MGLGIEPIGYVRGGRSEATDDYWGSSRAVIELTGDYGDASTASLDQFSHLEVVFVFDRVDPASVQTGARHPRNRADWPLVGIFAQRGRRRPNRLGVSRCRIVGVHGARIEVEGLDAVDGTPVLDVKPWMAEFGPIGATRQPEWSTELMRDYYAEGAARRPA